MTFFTKPDCSLCNAAWFVIRKVQRNLDIEIMTVDITAPGNEEWYQAYRHDIPVVHLDGTEIFRHRVHEGQLRKLLN